MLLYSFIKVICVCLELTNYVTFLNPLYTGNPKGSTSAHNADPDLMPINVASDQGLHCLLMGFPIKNKSNKIGLTSRK